MLEQKGLLRAARAFLLAQSKNRRSSSFPTNCPPILFIFSVFLFLYSTGLVLLVASYGSVLSFLAGEQYCYRYIENYRIISLHYR